jgi:RNA polymerase sigma-70 factor (ECF subfamily)
MDSTRYPPFPETHWSLIHRARAVDEDARRQALDVLLRRYQPAMECYLLTIRRLPPSVVDDLLQSFLADKFLQQKFLAYADAERGRFRTFLLTSLNHYVSSSGRRLKTRLTRALPDAEEILDLESAPPPAILEAAWARALILNVIQAMREECEATQRRDVWLVFEGRILGAILEHRELVPYENLAATLNLKSPLQAANLLVTAKRMYARLLRKAVGEYEMESEVSQEIHELTAILRRGSASS